MKFQLKIFILFTLILLPLSSFAIDDEALIEVQALMQDRQKMEQLAAQDAQVKKADDFVNQVVGTGKEKDDLYKISSEVMGQLARKHKGDVGAMQADLLQALKDPKKFLDSLPSDQKKLIRDLASQVESKGTISMPAAQPKP